MATRPSSASAAPRCRRASGSGSRWRGRFSPIPTVLVLDEPSAALDVHAEQRIAAGYERVMRGRTTIVITHRAELAARADRVLSLEPELAYVS